MGDYSKTYAISGLPIGGGDTVRCLLLTESPYGDECGISGGWIVRTPPLRATYDGYGSVRDVHPDDAPIGALWRRGLREDTVEIGQGDNLYHDVPVARDAPLDQLIDAARAGRLLVRQDTEHYWRSPRPEVDPLPGPGADRLRAREAAVPTLRRVEAVLADDADLAARYPDPVARSAAPGKFVVDEPVPQLVRVRFGARERGPAHDRALGDALDAVRRAGLTGVAWVPSGSATSPPPTRGSPGAQSRATSTTATRTGGGRAAPGAHAPTRRRSAARSSRSTTACATSSSRPATSRGLAVGPRGTDPGRGTSDPPPADVKRGQVGVADQRKDSQR